MSLPGAATMLFHVGFGFIGGLWSSDNSKCFLEGFLEGACLRVFCKDKVLRRVLRRERFIEGA